MPAQPQNSDPFVDLISDIIKKHTVLYGPQIAISKARDIEGLVLSEEGELKQITGDAEYILRQLIAKYMDLSTHITKSVFLALLENYPEGTKKHFDFMNENLEGEKF